MAAAEGYIDDVTLPPETRKRICDALEMLKTKRDRKPPRKHGNRLPPRYDSPVALRFRSYGTSGPPVVLLHGGPGAPGYMAPVAKELGRDFRVLEPFQRPSGGESLTVARHVDDLREFLAQRCPGEHPALVGSSWGAMLALCFAAAHPEVSGPVVMVGSGTFDLVARARYKAILASRVDAAVRARLDAVDREEPDPDRRLARRADILMALELVAPVHEEFEEEPVDARSNAESWADMVRLQEAGVYPASFARVTAPVLMLHGDHDSHPFEEIRASLLPFVPHLESVLLPRCGHYPWVERHAREEFYRVLREWLGRQGGSLQSCR